MTSDSCPSGWAKTCLGELLPLSYGKALTEKNRGGSGAIPVYGSSGIVGVHDSALVDGPALIVGRKGNVGSVYLAEEKFWAIDTAYFTQGHPGLRLDYFKYLLEFVGLRSLDKSTAVPGLSRDDYSKVEICFPPTTEQHRVVVVIETLLSDLDAAVAALKRVHANLKRYRASVLKAACEGRLVPTEAELARKEGRSYESGEQLLQRILKERRAKWEADQLAKLHSAGKAPKNNDWKGKYREPAAVNKTGLRPLSEGWAWVNLGQPFEVCVGATPSRRRPEYWHGDIPWVSSGEVAFCRIKDTRELISEAGLQNTSTRLHPVGTVLLGMIGEGKTRGQVAILDIPACNNQNCAAIRVSEAGILPEFVYRYFEGEYERTRAIGSGNNQPALNKTRVEEMLMPFPPLAEQRRISVELESRLSIIEANERQVADALLRAARLRQSILKRAFEGKLVPQDPNDEPASVLLERICAERAATGQAKKPDGARPQRKKNLKA